MKPLLLTTKIDSYPFQIEYKDAITLIGSCFSDDIGNKFNYFGFNSLSNPFGTLFHPSAIARNIKECFEKGADYRIIERDGVYLSLNAGAEVYGLDEQELQTKFDERRALLKNALHNSSIVFVTFGTSWAYTETESGYIVANCHKLPTSLFERGLTPLEEMFQDWSKVISLLKTQNPSIKIVFTVSPVRHSKEGLIENNRSKARLIELVSELSEIKDVYYFPSYEIVIDELRDYRFFKEDLVHPSQQAIDYIWEKLVSVLFTDQSKPILKLVEDYRILSNHKVLHPGSPSERSMMKKLDSLREKLEDLQISLK
jgi:hypothetical protein